MNDQQLIKIFNNMIKKEQYEKLADYKPYLDQAKSNFCRISNSNLRAVSDIYFEVTGKRLTPSQLNCTSCVLKMLKELHGMVEQYEVWLSKMAEGRKNRKENTEPEADSNQGEPEPVE